MDWIMLRHWLNSNWKLLIMLALVTFFVVFSGYRKISGIEAIVYGRIIRIEQGTSAELNALAWIKLDNGLSLSAPLPSRTNCITGSRIELARRSSALGYQYQPTLKACDTP